MEGKMFYRIDNTIRYFSEIEEAEKEAIELIDFGIKQSVVIFACDGGTPQPVCEWSRHADH
jgi:hypothetical protein